ncbi:MAG: hypothetical protein R2845_00765 [Thermomicrobiales bacterium]
MIANSPVVHVVTNEGIDGWSQIETPKPYVQSMVLMLKLWLVGEEPTNLERALEHQRFNNSVGVKQKGSGDFTGRRALTARSTTRARKSPDMRGTYPSFTMR